MLTSGMELNPYAVDLGGQDPIPVLMVTAETLFALTRPLSLAQADQAPAPGKWSIREIVAHLADCEIAFSFRLRQTLAEDHPILQPFDQEKWAQRYGPYDLQSGLRMFDASRNWNAKLLTTITEEDRRRHVTHPERGTMSFWTIVETMAGHDIHHLEQIKRIVSNLS